MSNDAQLVVAMAERCRELIDESSSRGADQPESLRPSHLRWMCTQIAEHAADWPRTKVARWVGFVQAGMIANQMLSLAGAKRMFDDAKNAFGSIDQDLVDHLDASASFELDIGGQG